MAITLVGKAARPGRGDAAQNNFAKHDTASVIQTNPPEQDFSLAADPVTGIAGSNRLAILAAEIRAEHEASEAATRKGLEHAIACGTRLIEAKALLNRHGAWLPWLAEHCGCPARTASHYMRLARHSPEIGNVADLTVRDAIKLLAQDADEPEESEREIPFDILDLSIYHFVLLKLWRIDTRIRLNPTGLELPPDLSCEQWLAVGRVLVDLPAPDIGPCRTGRRRAQLDDDGPPLEIAAASSAMEERQ
jgi:Protein of unknown function (DUF3102)